MTLGRPDRSVAACLCLDNVLVAEDGAVLFGPPPADGAYAGSLGPGSSTMAGAAGKTTDGFSPRLLQLVLPGSGGGRGQAGDRKGNRVFPPPRAPAPRPPPVHHRGVMAPRAQRPLPEPRLCLGRCGQRAPPGVAGRAAAALQAHEGPPTGVTRA
jgi:hypothetical protein